MTEDRRNTLPVGDNIFSVLSNMSISATTKYKDTFDHSQPLFDIWKLTPNWMYVRGVKMKLNVNIAVKDNFLIKCHVVMFLMIKH